MFKKQTLVLTLCLLAVAVLLSGCSKNKKNNSSEDTLSGYHYVALELDGYGTITLELDADSAPMTVANFLSLVDSGFYNGLTFHRICPGFMIQGGDPRGDGTGSAPNKITGEFQANGIKNPISHVRGTISMARAEKDYDSASSQFFIVQMDSTGLDGQYAGFGKVIAGMDVVDLICVTTSVEDENGLVKKENQPVITRARAITKEEADDLVAADNVVPDPSATISFQLIDSADGLSPVKQWELDPSGELFLISTDTLLQSISLYHIDLSGELEETSDNLLAVHGFLAKEEALTLRITVPEGMPNAMLVVKEQSGAVSRYLISYDGLNGGAYLIPLLY